MKKNLCLLNFSSRLRQGQSTPQLERTLSGQFSFLFFRVHNAFSMRTILWNRKRVKLEVVETA